MKDSAKRIKLKIMSKQGDKKTLGERYILLNNQIYIEKKVIVLMKNIITNYL